MSKKLCIHGHFYQPPREDPWFGKIFLEGSAAPMRHWNERITRESYAPLAWARRLDSQGRIADLMNCYEWISFNIGPTLMLWLERQRPELLERIIEADRLSSARWGHGNAIAQVFHHSILPLASQLDKELEIAWAIEDFQHRFGRDSDGLWLAECAVDTATLETVAAQGLKFVVLSPHQARLIHKDGQELQVNASTLDYGQPHKIILPSGSNIVAFFYEAALAQAVAFDGVLSDGEKFWQRIRAAAAAIPAAEGLLTLATDGETYGHHFTFGEMALAYVLAQGYAGRDDITLTNFASYLDSHAAEQSDLPEVELYNPSSWSCAHGVERWRSNCGCSTGGHPGWNQEWRTSLREALNFVKSHVDEYFFKAGSDFYLDPRVALLNYGAVLVGSEKGDSFAKKYFKPEIIGTINEMHAWMLLRMQEGALASFASCSWFFDDISRIEPINAMSVALLSMSILEMTGGPSIQNEFEDILQDARSNIPEEGTGKDIFERIVLPSRMNPAKLCLFTYLYAYATGQLPEKGMSELINYPALSVRLFIDKKSAGGFASGRVVWSFPESKDGMQYKWSGRLPYSGTNDFVSFSEAFIEAGSDEKNSQIFSCKCNELASHLQDFLSLMLLENIAKEQHSELLAAARQVVSTLHHYTEGQERQNSPRSWNRVAPYIPLAVYASPLSDSGLEQADTILNEILVAEAAIQEAGALLEAGVLHDIENSTKSDDEIAAGLRRVNKVFKRSDWWRVQNKLWQDGRVNLEFSAVARELSFRVE